MGGGAGGGDAGGARCGLSRAGLRGGPVQGFPNPPSRYNKYTRSSRVNIYSASAISKQ